jgi:hypothetical protein
MTKQIVRICIFNMENCVKNLLAELIFNINDFGSQEWVDHKPRGIIIPG